MIFRDLAATVGRTPMIALGRPAKGLPGRVVAKLEMRNPCGSVKDRLGVALIEDAERRGVLRPGVTLVEATGGTTGVGLALAAAIRGQRHSGCDHARPVQQSREPGGASARVVVVLLADTGERYVTTTLFRRDDETGD